MAETSATPRKAVDMTDRKQRRIVRAVARAAVASQADWVAEAIMLHTDCCYAHQLACQLLEDAEEEPMQFLVNWVAGAYDNG